MDEAAESAGALKADAVFRDSAHDDDDDDDVSDIDLDDARVCDEEDLHRAFAGLRALTKAGLRLADYANHQGPVSLCAR